MSRLDEAILAELSEATAEEIEALGGHDRWARLRQAATMDVMVWAIDFEIMFGRKPTEDEVVAKREACRAARMKPGLMWPGIDFW